MTVLNDNVLSCSYPFTASHANYNPCTVTDMCFTPHIVHAGLHPHLTCLCAVPGSSTTWQWHYCVKACGGRSITGCQALSHSSTLRAQLYAQQHCISFSALQAFWSEATSTAHLAFSLKLQCELFGAFIAAALAAQGQTSYSAAIVLPRCMSHAVRHSKQ